MSRENISFTASPASKPENLTLKASLGWHYFFENGWAVVKTADGAYIVADEAMELSSATVFPDEEELLSWLESVVDDHLSDDPISFLRSFVTVDGLIDEFIAEAMVLKINE